MFDLIKKTMLTGIGLAAMTKDKVEEVVKDLTEKGEISEKEGKEFLDDLLKKSEQARKELETKVEGLVRKALGKMDLAIKKDIDRLEERVKYLEKKEAGDNTDDISQ